MRKKHEIIEGCFTKAGNDEMMFVLLSRDSCAAVTVRFWIKKKLSEGKNKPDDQQILEALECARVMDREGRIHKP